MKSIINDPISSEYWQAAGDDRYRELFEDAPIAYLELDCTGIIRRVNRAQCRLLGFTEAEMMGKTIWEFMPETQKEVSRVAFGRMMAGHPPPSSARRELATRGRSRITTELHYRVIHDNAGRVVGVRIALVNVTEQAVAEEALLTSRRWLSGVLQSLPDAVIAVDPLGGVEFMNPSGESITGWREADARSKDIAVVLVLANPREGSGEPPLSRLLSTSFVQPATVDATLGGHTNAGQRVRITSSPIVADEKVVIGAALIVRPLLDDQSV